MTRRAFLVAVGAAPVAGAVWASWGRQGWRAGTVIGRCVRTGAIRPAWAGDIIFGVWDGRRIVRSGPAWVTCGV